MPTDVIHAEEYAAPDSRLPRIAWTPESEDLHVNLVTLNAGSVIGEHTNQTLDVLLTCLEGAGELRVDGDTIPLHSGTIVLIPKGTKRSITAGGGTLRYITCHRKRGGIMPTVQPRS